MQVFVPARYIKDAAIDDRAETLDCLGAGMTIRGRWGCRFVLPPVTFGVMTVLEALECRFIPEPLTCSADDILTALVVNFSGRNSIRYIDNPAMLRRHVRVLRFFLFPRLEQELANITRHFHETPFTGFGMIKKKNPSAEKWWFGPTQLASIIYGVGQHTGYTVDDIRWKIPLSLVGHIIASIVASRDEFAVGRQKNEQDVRAQIAAAVARELAGELHPWQREMPEDYPLSDAQKAARPDVVGEFEALLSARKKR